MLPWENSFDVKVLVMVFNQKIFWVVYYSVKLPGTLRSENSTKLAAES